MNPRIATPIAQAELERRWAALRRAMREHGIDALILQGNNDWLGGAVRWLTDCPALNGYPRSIIFRTDAPMSVVEMGAFAAHRTLTDDDVQRGVGEWFGVPAFQSVGYTTGYEGALIAANLRRHGDRHVALVNGGAMPHRFVNDIRSALADRGVTLSDATDLVDQIKAIKSPTEIALIRETAKLQDAVFAAVLAGIRPGMRDCDITALAQHQGQVLGSEQGIFLGGSAKLGERSSFLGRNQQSRRLERGDHLSLLIEINGPGGFYGEIARTLVLGRASAELLDGFEAVRAAQDHTLGLIRPGASCAAIASAHNDYMIAHGLPAERRLYAHGQGYDMVERPLIRHDETMQLAAHMCLAVHPGYETASMFAVICDNYLVTETGVSACLHQTEKRVFEIDA